MPQAPRPVMPRLAAMSRSRAPGSRAMHVSARAWLVRNLQFVTIKTVTGWLVLLGRSSAFKDKERGQLPGPLAVVLDEPRCRNASRLPGFPASALRSARVCGALHRAKDGGCSGGSARVAAGRPCAR